MPLCLYAVMHYLSSPHLRNPTSYNPSNDRMSEITSAFQPPPGHKPIVPTPSNPRPSQNPPTFNDAMVVRQKVFIEEQGVAAEAEIDSDDARSWQWVLHDTSTTNGSRTDGNESQNAEPAPIGVIRLVPPPHPPHEALTHPEKAGSLPEYDLDHESCVKVTRVAVVPEYRGTGMGRRLVEMALEWAGRNAGAIDESYATFVGKGSVQPWKGLVLVHAQVDVEKMYQRLGFETDESLGRWDEEGIEHVGMWRRVSI